MDRIRRRGREEGRGCADLGRRGHGRKASVDSVMVSACDCRILRTDTNLWKHVDQAAEKECWNDLYSERYAPLSAITSTRPGEVATIAGPSSKYLAQRIEQLLKTGHLSSNATMGDFCLENRNDHGQKSNAETSNEPAGIQHADSDTGRLYNAADDEDTRRHQDCASSTELVGEACSKGAEEASAGEESDDGSGSSVGVLLQEQSLERVGCYDFCYHRQVVSEQERS